MFIFFKTFIQIKLHHTYRDYNEFMDDLEEDIEFRQNVNIYKNKSIVPVDTDDMDDSGAPRITLEEMLDDLVIDEDENDVEME